MCLQQLKSKNKEINRLEMELERCRSKCSQAELQIGADKSIIVNLTKKISELDFVNNNNKANGQINTFVDAENSPNLEEPKDEIVPNQKQSSVKHLVKPIDKNVDFLLDLQEKNDNKKFPYRNATITTKFDDCIHKPYAASHSKDLLLPSSSSLIHQYHHETKLKNHLFTHIKERPQLKEVNVRTNIQRKARVTNVLTPTKTNIKRIN